MGRMALVVDDSMLIRHTVCRFLEQRGFAVESATNGVDALERLNKMRPDIIVTDILMPKMTGSELITALRDNQSTRDIPIVILAGRSSRTDQPQEQRADYVIYKDIDIESQLEKGLTSALGETASVRTVA
jgi:CheY-like chemotaxis protein